MKRPWYVVLILLYVIAIGLIVSLFYPFHRGSTGSHRKEQQLYSYTIKTHEGDAFRIIGAQGVMGPEANIYACAGGRETFIASIEYAGWKKRRLPLTLLNDSAAYRAYDVCGTCAIIKDKQSARYNDVTYECLDISLEEFSNPRTKDVYTYMFHVVQQKILTREWLWFDNFAEFLVYNHDKATIRMVQRYADGNFTKEELAINSHTTGNTGYRPITKQAVISKASWLVSEYGL